MIHHDAAILDDFDPGFGECFGHGIVVNSGLQPNRLRHLRQDIFNVRRNIFRSSKDVHEIDIDRNINEAAKDLLPEYVCRFRVIDRHGNDLKAGVLQVTGDIEGWLVCLGLGLDTEHRDGPCFVQQRPNVGTVLNYVGLRIHEQ